MTKKNLFKSGDRVRFKDIDTRVFIVHTVYDNNKVFTGLV